MQYFGLSTWAVSQHSARPLQLLVSRETGKVRASTYLGDYRVCQALRLLTRMSFLTIVTPDLR
jgi:hypothetical protein